MPGVLVNGTLGAIQGIIRTGLEAMLLYYTFKGRKWAKNIMIVLSSIAIFVVLILCINLIHATMHPVMYIIMYIVFIITLALNSGLIYIVAFSPSFKEYLKSLNI